jgi:hypothetical protein
MKADDLKARIFAAAGLIPPEPQGPRPGTPCLYRGGEVLWVDRGIPDLPAPAGSLELYLLLNKEELDRAQDQFNQRMADCIYQNINTSEGDQSIHV